MSACLTYAALHNGDLGGGLSPKPSPARVPVSVGPNLA